MNLNHDINAIGNYWDNLALLREKLNAMSHLSFIGNGGDKPVND